jgi:hypothetical protein
MPGTDDRSPGSIEDLALSWGLSPERAREVAATAAALAAGAYPEEIHLPQPRRTAPRLPAQRQISPAERADDVKEVDEPELDTEVTR